MRGLPLPLLPPSFRLEKICWSLKVRKSMGSAVTAGWNYYFLKTGAERGEAVGQYFYVDAVLLWLLLLQWALKFARNFLKRFNMIFKCHLQYISTKISKFTTYIYVFRLSSHITTRLSILPLKASKQPEVTQINWVRIPTPSLSHEVCFRRPIADFPSNIMSELINYFHPQLRRRQGIFQNTNISWSINLPTKRNLTRNNTPNDVGHILAWRQRRWQLGIPSSTSYSVT